jgi:hypothetical protein
MTGAIAMGTNKITGLGTPTSNTDAATKAYADLMLPLTGGTMSGAIAMGTNKITGAGDPTNAQDVATKNYIDTLFGSTTAAAASAAAAATSASNASTSASNAATSASNAASSASSASSAATSAANSYDAFDDRYLGQKSSDPSVDNDGNALLTGALYFNTSDNAMKVYTGSAWANVAPTATSINLATQTTGTLAVGSGGTGATTLTGVLKGNGTSAFTAATAGTDFVAPGTATTFTATQTLSGSSTTIATVLKNAAEATTISATAATGTINFDVLTQAVVYYTSNASANWTLNVRGSSSTSLNTLMSTGQSVTIAFLVTQGSTAYYQSAFQVDGSSVTPKWQGGTAPTAGNASSIDAYVVTIFKTGSGTFTAFASQTRFA